jgi:hypothetical protein
VGRWTASDVDALRRLKRALSSSQWKDVLEVLIPALNSGAIKAEVRGPPF